MNIKAIAIDLDGTLLDSNGILSANNRDTLIKVQESGVKLIVVTGRKLCECEEILREICLEQFSGVAILSDGQYTYDFSSGEITVNDYIDLNKSYKNVLSIFSVNYFKIITPDLDYMYFDKLSLKMIVEIIKNVYRKKKIQLLYRDNCLPEKVEKIIIYQKRKEDYDACNFENLEAVYINHDERYELKKKGVNKGNALIDFANKSCYTNENIAVFGNDENDVSMFCHFTNSFISSESPKYLKEKVGQEFAYSEGKSLVYLTINKMLNTLAHE